LPGPETIQRLISDSFLWLNDNSAKKKQVNLLVFVPLCGNSKTIQSKFIGFCSFGYVATLKQHKVNLFVFVPLVTW